MSARATRLLLASTLALVVPGALAACKTRDRADGARSEGEPATSAPAPLAPDAATPPRCSVAPGGLALAPAEERRFLSIGDAVAAPGGFAVGLLRTVAGNMQASIARIPGDLARATLVDLGPIAPDGAPPRPLVHGNALYALTALATARPDATRGRQDGGLPRRVTPLVLSHIGETSAETLGSVLEVADESLGADALVFDAYALIAWDEDAPGRDRGIIKVARLPLQAPAARPLADGGAPARAKPSTGAVVSPEGSDAEAPRLAPRPGGAWLVWTARRPEPPSDASVDDTRIEGPAERRAYQWIEIVALDDAGAAVGAARRLTSLTGHAGAFDLAPRAGGDLDVLVRDDDEAGEAAGGAVRRFTVKGEAVDGPVTLAADGVGRGTIDVVGGPGGEWLAFDDPSDHTRASSLASLAAGGAPSIEPALDGGRLLIALGTAESDARGPASLVAAFPSGDFQLRRVTCGR